MRTLRPSRSALFLVLALALAGCASGGGSGESAEAPRRSSNRISSEELQTVSSFDLYTAIGRLRPQWLRPGTRGTLPGVIVNGAPQAGGMEMLRSLRASEVSSLELLDASDATTRFGTGYMGGAILVTTGR